MPGCFGQKPTRSWLFQLFPRSSSRLRLVKIVDKVRLKRQVFKTGGECQLSHKHVILETLPPLKKKHKVVFVAVPPVRTALHRSTKESNSKRSQGPTPEKLQLAFHAANHQLNLHPLAGWTFQREKRISVTMTTDE